MPHQQEKLFLPDPQQMAPPLPQVTPDMFAGERLPQPAQPVEMRMPKPEDTEPVLRSADLYFPIAGGSKESVSARLNIRPNYQLLARVIMPALDERAPDGRLIRRHYKEFFVYQTVGDNPEEMLASSASHRHRGSRQRTIPYNVSIVDGYTQAALERAARTRDPDDYRAIMSDPKLNEQVVGRGRFVDIGRDDHAEFSGYIGKGSRLVSKYHLRVSVDQDSGVPNIMSLSTNPVGIDYVPTISQKELITQHNKALRLPDEEEIAAAQSMGRLATARWVDRQPDPMVIPSTVPDVNRYK